MKKVHIPPPVFPMYSYSHACYAFLKKPKIETDDNPSITYCCNRLQQPGAGHPFRSLAVHHRMKQYASESIRNVLFLFRFHALMLVKKFFELFSFKKICISNPVGKKTGELY
jgi:hypothetical protein